MQINSINKCCKPTSFNSFSGNRKTDGSAEQIRYKHFEQMDDDILGVISIARAHQKIQQGGKMKLFKAMPSITLALTGASLALAQPGKLATKAVAGLGFLAVTKAYSKIMDGTSKIVDEHFEEKDDKDAKKKTVTKALTTIGAIAGFTAGAIALAKGAKALTSKYAKPFENFISGEAVKLKNEINNSKLGKFFENTVNPLSKKHEKITNVVRNVLPFAAIFSGTLGEIKLAKSLSNDVKEQAKYNFIKARIIQQTAREHFDSIDAVEV